MRRSTLAAAPAIALLAFVAFATPAGSAPATSPTRPPRARGSLARPCPVFPKSNPLNQEIAHAPIDPRSARYIASIGPALHLHADFGTDPAYGIPYAVVAPRQPKVPIHFTAYRAESDPGPYPIPPDAPVEGAGEEGDRRVLVLQEGACKLYELSPTTAPAGTSPAPPTRAGTTPTSTS